MAMLAVLAAVTILLVSILVVPLFHHMPHPYRSVTAMEISPERIQRMPSSAPTFSGKFQRNERLKNAVRLFEGQVHGSESVAVLKGGELLMLDKYGYLLRATRTEDGNYKSTLDDGPRLYIGPGRPLGYHVVDGGAALLVCDSVKGLLHLELDTGKLDVLSNSVGGRPLNYANDLDVGADGTVYFSSSTELSVALSPTGFYDTMRSAILNSMHGDPTGRLLAYDPKTRVTRELQTHLFYANGVAVAQDGRFVAVVETSGYRVLRYWIDGPRLGETDVLIADLPGVPDGITRASDGNFWLCLILPGSPLFKLMAPYPWLRQLLSHVILAVGVPVKKWGCVLKVSPEGEVLEALFDPEGEHISSVSAVTEHNGTLFFGNLAGDYVSMLRL